MTALEELRAAIQLRIGVADADVSTTRSRPPTFRST